MIKKMTIAFLTIVFFNSCDVNKTKEGELPEVDITTEEGELPEYDVNWADVNVGTTTKTVEVPKVVIVMEEEEVEVPYLDVDMPGSDDEKEERTILVQAEVEGKEHEIDIKEIWATGNNLYVISVLTATEQDIDDKKMRVSDQVTINAPELNVKHYIIGERPNRVFNDQYTYVKDIPTLKYKLDNKNIKVIFSQS